MQCLKKYGFLYMIAFEAYIHQKYQPKAMLVVSVSSGV